MTTSTNHLDQPIGAPLDGWAARPFPPHEPLNGRFCRVVPLDPAAHAEPLFRAFAEETEGRGWTYLPYGPFEDFEKFRAWLASIAQASDPQFYAIVEVQSGEAVGVASYLRIAPDIGSIEVGHIHFAPRLQRTPAATEAMYLMMRRAFEELGYRRYEWKCDALNAGSCGAAQRLGFQPEGIFRQATMYKGRNRDTAWFSIIDGEWPALERAFEEWLNEGNFDAEDQQLQRLSDFMPEEMVPA